MADVFISYKREDRPFAERLSIVLEQLGFEVWWDFDLLSGDRYRRVIRAIIDECKVAVVVWSELAVQSDFVLDEAEYAKGLGKLCPARIDNVALPFGFGSIHTDDLRSWDGELFDAHFQSLVKAIERRVGRKGRLGESARPMETQAAAAEMEAFKAAQLADAIPALETFLDLYPRGAFASFVRRQLENMRVEAPVGRAAARTQSPAAPPRSARGPRVPSSASAASPRQAPNPPRREGAERPLAMPRPTEATAPPARAPRPARRQARLNPALIAAGGAAAALIVAYPLARLWLRPAAPTRPPAAAAKLQSTDVGAAAPTNLATPLVGVWAPVGLTCADAVTISAAGGILTVTSAGVAASAAIQGLGAGGAIDVTSKDGNFSYKVHGDTLTRLSPDGAASRMTRCGG